MRLLFAALVVSAAVVGPSAAIAGSSFAARANGICESYYKKLNAVPVPRAKTAKAVAAYEKRVLPLGAAELAQFKRMTPPASIRSSYKAWIAVTEREQVLVEKMIAAGEKNDVSVVRKLLVEGSAIDRRYNALANKMGMHVCGQPTSKTK